jgi:hypothetical protein
MFYAALKSGTSNHAIILKHLYLNGPLPHGVKTSN